MLWGYSGPTAERWGWSPLLVLLFSSLDYEGDLIVDREWLLGIAVCMFLLSRSVVVEVWIEFVMD